MARLLSITDAAREIGLSRPRLSKIIKQYQITKTKAGGTHLINFDELEELIKELKSQGKVRGSALVSDAPPAQGRGVAETFVNGEEANLALRAALSRLNDLENELREQKMRQEVTKRRLDELESRLNLSSPTPSESPQSSRKKAKNFLTNCFSSW